MGFGLFDNANLAVIGYASVRADGTLRAADNLEIFPAHVPGGAYIFMSPVNIQGTREPVFSDDDICIITPTNSGSLLPLIPAVQYSSNTVRAVIFFPQDAGAPVDTDFTIMILRTLIKAPTP